MPFERVLWGDVGNLTSYDKINVLHRIKLKLSLACYYLSS